MSSMSSRKAPPLKSKSKTFAATRRSQHTSTVCAISQLFGELTRLDVGDIEEYETPSSAYNLQQLCDMESVTYDSDENMDESSEKVEKVGMDYVSKIVGDIPGVLFACDQEAASFKNLPISCYSSRQRPDVSILYGGFIILLIEIESCSSSQAFINTMRKTVMGLIDTLRWYRLHGTCSISEWTGFTFPKFKKKECVVQVTVIFNPYTFTFKYQFRKIAKDRVREEVKCTFEKNFSTHRKIRDLHEVHEPDWYMKLSNHELDIFKGLLHLKSVQQMASKQSLLLKGDDYCYKFPIHLADSQAMCTAVLSLDYPRTSGFVIGLQMSKGTPYKGCFKYKYVCHGYLDTSEVKRCLGDFVSQILLAIESLHKCGLAHLDIRLDNICISEDYKPILIDLDRARSTDMWSHNFVYPHSVMYKCDGDFMGVQHDWLQLACIILWVLTEDIQPSSYHFQNFNVDHDVVKNKFFVGLRKGQDI